MKNRPAYGLDSVDHALHLATILAQEGSLGVSEAAQRLGVARSTAHRLLSMLVYRDFAARDDRRRYVAGPVLRTPGVPEPVAALRRLALPHLEELTARTGETSHLGVLVGSQVRMIATVECRHTLRVGEREGRVLPAHLASLGRAMLADLSPGEVRTALAEVEGLDVDRLLGELARVRREGVATNHGRTETGLVAIGSRLETGTAELRAAVSVAMPVARYDPARRSAWITELRRTADAIDLSLRVLDLA
ncbi:IclR family transcriptional regulator [Pseudonocardia sp. HH130630-07]|uniref:IclR family transcriptional regulator n=1 Tax=Pseudonocardia sp. HH130630-07 TaxID=1690815 RepID=UPI000814BB06|nr:IclR family transcriptional regulator [Pseudonocardia sp. HH130630-07]ANY08827.1 hypothetical protein AFB00_24070 [Pseudonocardia sp. HH130630-07]